MEQRLPFDRLLAIATFALWMYVRLRWLILAQVLEVGCGRGDLWKKNATRISSEWHITLTDFSEGMLDDCKSYLGKELGGRFEYNIVDVQNIPYEESRFDIVIANYMLYHVPDRAKAIGEIRRVLKPSGVLLAMTNGDRHLHELFALAKQFDDTFEETDFFGSAFSLQNGSDQLSAHFDNVSLERMDNSLYVREVQPLLDYIASMIRLPGEAILSQHGKGLTAEIQKRIDTDGGIIIQKETGLFIASP